MRAFKGAVCSSVFVILNCFFGSAHAVEPPLAERGFYKHREKVGAGWSMLPGPWVDVESIGIAPENKEAVELRDWLRYYRTYLEAWPPRYSDDEEAVYLIEAWQGMRPRVEQWQASLKESPELAALAVTFWAYGHNLEERDASDRAFELLDELRVKFGTHPLPPMMKGMLLSRTGGKGAYSILGEARTRTKDKRLRGLIEMTIAQQCMFSFRLHRSLHALSEAIDACPACVLRYKQLAFTVVDRSGSDPGSKLENPYFLKQEEARQIAGSHFYGFEAALLYDWSVDRHGSYDPQNPMGAILFNAAPLSDSGLVHGVMFFTAVVDESVKRPSAFLKLFSGPEHAVTVTGIKPLVKNPQLTDWYRLDTRDRVGRGDMITMVAASGILRPKHWTIPDHRRLARDEGPCELPDLKSAELHILTQKSRVRAPVEFTVNYSASRNSYAEAERKMKEIVSALEFSSYAYSDVEAKLLRALNK
jgi:hypothetical protein